MSFGHTPYSTEEFQRVQQNLNKNLGPEYISERTGPGNSKLKYLEGWKLGNLANEILGYNGWSHSIISQTVDFVDVQDGKYAIGISSIVRVTLKDGSYHEDCGYGSIEGCRQKDTAFEKAKKESVTDALKRTLKHFGNALGNCIYSKEYLKRIGKMGNPAPPPIDPSMLYRAPGFAPPSVPKANPVPTAPVPAAFPKPSTAAQPIPPPQKLDCSPDDYGLSDDDEAMLMAADLECISVNLLQDTLTSNVTDTTTILPLSLTKPIKPVTTPSYSKSTSVNSVSSVPTATHPSKSPYVNPNVVSTPSYPSRSPYMNPVAQNAVREQAVNQAADAKRTGTALATLNQNVMFTKPSGNGVAQPNKNFGQNGIYKANTDPSKPFVRSISSPSSVYNSKKVKLGDDDIPGFT